MPRKVKKQQRTRVVILLDSSSSMSYLRTPTISCVNGIIDSIQKNAESTQQETFVSLYTFADDTERKYFDENVKNIHLNRFSQDNYRTLGNTALLDCIGLAIADLEGLKDSPDTSYLILVVTDGEENRSKRYNASQINNALRRLQGTDRWSFVFNVPKGNYRDRLHDNFEIPIDNIREWEQTEEGVVETRVETQSAMGNYFAARAKGITKTCNFYTTDLSKLPVTKVHTELDDISDRFKVYEVKNEIGVKEFVEQKTKRDYIIGSTFYQLMKTERVQPSKEILIIEKGKKAVWGGQQARDLIGLPAGEECKVTPGNLNCYDIYIQSTSINRLLPRGTKVLVDLTKKKGSKPTWDHTATKSKSS